MFDDPKVISAIVAGMVSLIKSAASGIYTTVKSNKLMEVPKKELLVKQAISSYIEGKGSFGLTRKVTAHTLKDSLATHLLEQGTDVLYIQELLGPKHIKTSLIYTDVTYQTYLRSIVPWSNST